MTAQTFLISGAPGFLGSHFVHTLLSLGHNVVGLKRVSSNLWRLENVLQNKNLRLYNSDDTDLYKAFSEQHIDAVIHTACSYGRNGEPLSNIVETNVVFGLKLFEMCKAHSVQAFFNTDSVFNTGKLNGAYMSNYSLSKRHFVEWLEMDHENTKVFNMKLQHVYGANDGDKKFVSWLVRQLEQNVSEIPLTAGLQSRDFIYIADVISAYLIVWKNSHLLQNFEEFDVGIGAQITLKDFVSEITRQYKTLHPENKTTLAFGKIDYHKGELMHPHENIEKLCALGWKAKFDYKNGIKAMLKNTPPHYYNLLYFNNLHRYNSAIHLRICCGFCKEAA